MRRRHVAAAGVVLTLLLAGCSSSPPTLRATTTTTSSTTTTTTLAPTTTTVAPPTTSTTTTTTTTTLAPRVDFLAQSASFVNAQDGFVLGVSRCPPHNCLALRATTDGGSAWSDLTAPGAPNVHGLGGFSGIVFADPTDGWAIGHGFWSTHDGAVGWSQLRVGGTVEAVATGAGESYALVDPCEASLTCTTMAHLVRSPIAQDAWTKFTTTKFSRGLADLVVQGTTVFVFTQAIGASPASISASDNGGPFTAVSDPCPAGFSATSLAASSPTEVAVACLGPVSAGAAPKAVYVSSNGGQSFTALPTPPVNGTTATVALPSASTVVLSSNAGASDVFRLEAPAQSWTGTLSLADNGLGISDLTFIDAAHGFLVDGAAKLSLPSFNKVRQGSPEGEVFVSSSAGATWQPVPIER